MIDASNVLTPTEVGFNDTGDTVYGVTLVGSRPPKVHLPAAGAAQPAVKTDEGGWQSRSNPPESLLRPPPPAA